MIDFDAFDEMLNMSDPDFPEKLKAALGLKTGESLQIVTPQFDREDGVTPSIPDGWQKLRSLSIDTLKAIGCRPWEEEEKGVLMLFPYQWYDFIPDGFEIDGIWGGKETFKRGETDNDYRFGVLAYGVYIAFDQMAASSHELITGGSSG
jgi:hypothetical protein